MPATPDLPADLVGAVPFSDAEIDEALLVAQGIADGDAVDVDLVLTDDAWTLGADDQRLNPFRRWRPTTLDEAEWAGRKLAAVEARAADIDQQEAVWVARVRLWAEDERRRIAGARWFFRDRLERFALDVRAADDRQKTVRLPSVEVLTRSAGAKVVVTDEAAVLAWARSLPDEERAAVVKVKESVSLTGLREIVAVSENSDGGTITTYLAVHTASGEIVPGLGVDPGGLTASVKVEG